MHFRILLLFACASHSALAADWPQFRGDAMQASAGEKPLELLDAEGKPKIAWKAELPGRSAAGAIVVDGKVIVTSATGHRQDRLHVQAFDSSTGKPLWHRQFWATGRTICHPFSSVSANTPASDGKRIFAFFSSNDLFCLDLSGNLLWTRGLTVDYPTAANDVGMASSPVVVNGTVIVQVENEADSFAVGLDATTGKERWRADRPKQMNWCSPAIMPGDGGKSLVLLQSTAGLIAVEPATGKEVWKFASECDGTSSPLASSGMALAIAKGGVTALRQKGSTSEVESVWTAPKMQPGAASPVAHQGKVYAVNRAGVLSCTRLSDGEFLWQLRIKGPFWSTPIACGDQLICINLDGLLQVVKLGEKEGTVLGSAQLGDKVLGSPAVVDGAMYLRTENNLIKLGGK